MVSYDRKLECSTARHLIDFRVFLCVQLLASIMCCPEENMEWIIYVFHTAPQYSAINCIINDFIQIICPRERGFDITTKDSNIFCANSHQSYMCLYMQAGMKMAGKVYIS